jgi:NDP-sugar pyrophosphorylase family protein
LQYEEDQFPRGPAGCIKDAAERMTGDPIVVIEGTIVALSSVLSVPQLLDDHRRSGATMTVVTSPGARAEDHLRPAGIYVLQRRALDFVLETGFQDIKETMIPKLHRAGEHVAIHELRDVCRRVANLETYLSANFWLTERVAAAGRPMGGRRAAHGDVSIHPTAQVADDTLIVGPVLVGARARIQSGATVVGPAVIGDGAVVEAGALVSRSVVGNDCRISRHAIVHGCVVADDAAVESGAHLYHSMKQRERSKSTWLGRLAARWAEPRPRGPRPLGRPAIAESGLIQLPRRVASVPTGSDARR